LDRFEDLKNGGFLNEVTFLEEMLGWQHPEIPPPLRQSQKKCSLLVYPKLDGLAGLPSAPNRRSSSNLIAAVAFRKADVADGG